MIALFFLISAVMTAAEGKPIPALITAAFAVWIVVAIVQDIRE